MYKNACHIAKRELELNPHLDLQVVKLAALFHDIVDFKYDYTTNVSKSLEDIAHERLHSFFQSYKEEITHQQMEKIIHIILNISFRKELESKENQSNVLEELKIVRDADRLDAIGAVGIARCFGFSGAKKRPFHIEGVEPMVNMTAEQYNAQTVKNESTAINHFYEKLLLLKEKFLTETGKQLAAERHEFMLVYLKQFENECKIDS